MAGSRNPHRLSIPEDVVFEVLDGEAVLLNLATGVYFTLNATGTRIWDLIQEQRGDVEKIREAFLQEYEVEGATFDADLDRLLEELTERRLVVRDSGEDA